MSKAEKIQNIESSLAVPNIKYNCVAFIFRQINWLFMYASKYISSYTTNVKPTQTEFAELHRY